MTETTNLCSTMFDVWCFLCFILHPPAGEIVKNQRERTERTQSLINSRAAQSVKCSRALKGKHCKVDLCWSQCCKSIDAPWFFSGCFVVVRLAGIYIDFSLANISPGLFVSKCEQTWCKTKHIAYQNHPSLIPWFNSWRNPREGREEWDDPEVYPFKSWTRGPSDFSCQALAEGLKENSTLINLNLEQNRIGPEAAKAWCLVWMVWRRESEPQDFIGRSKIQQLENEVNEMLKGPESNARCLISNERQGNI